MGWFSSRGRADVVVESRRMTARDDDRFLEAMVYAMPDPVACVARGVVVGFNKAACALFLVDEATVMGKPLGDVVRCDERQIKDGAKLSSTRGDGRVLALGLSISDADGGKKIVVFQNGDAPRDPADDLSPRLREVLGLLTEGKAVKEIAFELKPTETSSTIALWTENGKLPPFHML